MINKPAILCVDDEATVLSGLKRQLRRLLGFDYTIEIAGSGDEALEIFHELMDEQIEVPLVISDQIMPGMYGDELLIQLHRIEPKTLKIMLTGQASADDVGHIINQGSLYRYMAKPWEEKDLELTVTEALRSYYQDKKVTQQNTELQAINDQLQQMNESLKALNKASMRFVPQEFLHFLNKDNITEVQLGDQVEHEMTIMFSDIRSFTALSESMTAQENFNFVNAYLSQVSPIIRQHQGFIDKFMGDAVMALFPDQPDHGLIAAIAMQQAVSTFNQQLTHTNQPTVKIGIGLHTGQVILGTVGETERLQSTVISDAVNLAARLEGLTKLYGAAIVVSENTLFSLDKPNAYHFRFLDKVMVKGKQIPISVFEILDGNPAQVIELKLKTRTDFEKGLLHYHSQEFEQATTHFTNVLQFDPTDKAAHLYLCRTQDFIKYGVPVDWGGVEALSEK